MNFLPLCTAIVCPTISGMMVVRAVYDTLTVPAAGPFWLTRQTGNPPPTPLASSLAIRDAPMGHETVPEALVAKV